MSHPHGNAENILRFVNNNKISVNSEQLRKIFDNAEVRDRKIVVFSIIGAYRKGKSFFLDYCLRFLYAHVSCLLNVNIFEPSIILPSIFSLKQENLISIWTESIQNFTYFLKNSNVFGFKSSISIFFLILLISFLKTPFSTHQSTTPRVQRQTHLTGLVLKRNH